MTGVARTTVRDMRRAGRWETGSLCPRCWRRARPMSFSAADYAQLLGLYLGDGHISRVGRTERLRLFLDSKYPMVVADVRELLVRCFSGNRPGAQFVHEGRMTVLSVYSCHVPCLFPQHGAGLKHNRAIALEAWQEAIIEQEPWQLLRGLIWSDGCSFVNRTGPYEYLTCAFSNRSAGIAGIFTDACDGAGIGYRCNLNIRKDLWEIRINRRESVAALREHVGVKR